MSAVCGSRRCDKAPLCKQTQHAAVAASRLALWQCCCRLASLKRARGRLDARAMRLLWRARCARVARTRRRAPRAAASTKEGGGSCGSFRFLLALIPSPKQSISFSRPTYPTHALPTQHPRSFTPHSSSTRLWSNPIDSAQPANPTRFSQPLVTYTSMGKFRLSIVLLALALWVVCAHGEGRQNLLRDCCVSSMRPHPLRVFNCASLRPA